MLLRLHTEDAAVGSQPENCPHSGAGAGAGAGTALLCGFTPRVLRGLVNHKADEQRRPEP